MESASVHIHTSGHRMRFRARARGTLIDMGAPHKASIFMVLHLQLRTHSCTHASVFNQQRAMRQD